MGKHTIPKGFWKVEKKETVKTEKKSASDQVSQYELDPLRVFLRGMPATACDLLKYGGLIHAAGQHFGHRWVCQ